MARVRIEGELSQVGWLVWNKHNPASREFSTQALTEADRKNGYSAKAVYEVVD